RPDWGEMARREIHASGKSVVYNRCVITAESARTVSLLVEPTGTAVVWLNGRELVRGKQLISNHASLALERGPNQLLVKLFNPGPHPMNPQPRYTLNLVRPFEVARQRNRALDRMWTRVRADFPDERSQREIHREQRDGIWLEGWPKGDVGVLAARYAAAVTGPASSEIRTQATQARTAGGLGSVRTLYNRARNLDEIREVLLDVQPEAVRLAVEDLVRTFGSRYAKGAEYQKRVIFRRSWFNPTMAPWSGWVSRCGNTRR
ncbi:MAG: hypothetical protein NTY38_15470, partial [Acidobacteria bacterium]|nr:hypothetical protein [Acidobacteriota bacterium]